MAETAIETPAAELIDGDAPKPTPKAPTQAVSGSSFPKDSLGREFDPIRFRADVSGNPKLDSKGRFIPVNLGRKSTTEPKSTPSESIISAPKAPEPPPPPDKFRVAALTGVSAYQAILVMLGQEEGLLSDAEKQAIQEPLEAVLRKYGVSDLPAEVALALAAGTVFLSRTAKPKTQTSVQKIRFWLGNKWAAWTGKRVAQKVAEVTQHA